MNTVGGHIVLSKRESHSYFLGYIKKRIEQNKNFMGVITGETGSGKSYSALRFAYDLDPEFNIDRVVFNNHQFTSIIDGGTLKRGSVIIYDEAGVGMNHNEWMSEQNTLIAKVLQTFRHRNFIVFFTTPNLSFLTADSRRLVHAHIETVGIDFNKNIAKLRPMFMQTNQRSGDVFFKYLRVIDPDAKNRKTMKLTRTSALMPPDELIELYEAKKKAFTTELFSHTVDRMANPGTKRKNNNKYKEEVKSDEEEKELIKKSAEVYIQSIQKAQAREKTYE